MKTEQIKKYISWIKKNFNEKISDDLIEKDLQLTLLLKEMQIQKEKNKNSKFHDFIFKGGTLLTRNYLKYHRISEDLDFTHINTEKFRKLSNKKRRGAIREFIMPLLKEIKSITEKLNFDFDTDRHKSKYYGHYGNAASVILKMYYNSIYTGETFIKLEINFIEKRIYPNKDIKINNIIDFLKERKKVKEKLYELGIGFENYKTKSYPINEIILEKYRAILTRKELKDRDVFDLYIISQIMKKNVLKAQIGNIVEKIKESAKYFGKVRNNKIIKESLNRLKKNEFVSSEDAAKDLSLVDVNLKDYDKFKDKLKLKLIKICQEYFKITKNKS